MKKIKTHIVSNLYTFIIFASTLDRAHDITHKTLYIYKTHKKNIEAK